MNRTEKPIDRAYWKRYSADLLMLCYPDTHPDLAPQHIAAVHTLRKPRVPKGRPVIVGYEVRTPNFVKSYLCSDHNETPRRVLAALKRDLPKVVPRYRCSGCGEIVPQTIDAQATWARHSCPTENEKSPSIMDGPQPVNPVDGCEAADRVTVSQENPAGDPPCAAGGTKAEALDVPKPGTARVDGNRHGRIWEDESERGDYGWPVTDAEQSALLCLIYREVNHSWPFWWDKLETPCLRRDEFRQLWRAFARSLEKGNNAHEVDHFVATLLGGSNA